MAPDLSRRDFLARSAATVAITALGATPAHGSSNVAPPDDLHELTATAAVEAMRRGDIRAEDYARALLSRSERLVSLNAFRVLAAEHVLESARAADKARAAGRRLGRLHGLPIPVKDSVNTAAFETTNGTASLRAFRPRADAGILAPLLAAGAVVMGKTNLHELSLGWTSRSAFGDVRNPYDDRHVPGGSSGGSAVAVAARLAPLAIAEDTLGSIRVPAAMCGICGLRPTYGRHPVDGIMPLATSGFDQVGPLARTVEDLALFDSVVSGEQAPLPAVQLRGVRIGVADFFFTDLDADVERVHREALERLREAGVELVRVDVPDEVKGAMGVAITMISFETSTALSAFLAEQGAGVTLEQMIAQLGPEVKPLFSLGQIPRAVYDGAVARRERLGVAIREHFARHNLAALALPTTMMAAPAIGDVSGMKVAGRPIAHATAMARNVALGSCARMSSLVLPAGRTPAGLPVGMAFDALPGTDRAHLALGVALQRALGAVAAPKV